MARISLPRLDDTEEQLKSGEPRVRIEAALELAKLGRWESLPMLVDHLDGTAWSERADAADALRRIGGTFALDRLTRVALHDELSDNRNAAIMAVGQIGTKEVVPVLIRALGDPESERREDARAALYRMLGQDVVDLFGEEDAFEEVDPGPSEEEAAAIQSWWEEYGNRLQPGVVYAFGLPASPGVWIEWLRSVRGGAYDGALELLEDWTGETFGEEPYDQVLDGWTRWWEAHADELEPGVAHFYGHPVGTPPG